MLGEIVINITGLGFAISSIIYLIVSIFFIYNSRQLLSILYGLYCLIIAVVSLLIPKVFQSIEIIMFILSAVSVSSGLLILIWIRTIELLNGNLVGNINGNKKLSMSLCLLLIGADWLWLSYPIINVSVIFLIHLMQIIYGITLLEGYWKNLSITDKWQLKPLAIYLLAYFVYWLSIFTVTIIESSMFNILFKLLGWLLILLVPLLFIMASRFRYPHKKTLYISREIVLSSSLMMIFGLFLTSVSFVYYQFENVIKHQFEFITLIIAIGLSTLLLTHKKLSKRLKVLVNKHFYTNRYDYRKEWMLFTHRLQQADAPYTSALYSLMNPLGIDQGMLFTLENKKLCCLAKATLKDNHPVIFNELVQLLVENKWILDLNKISHEEIERYNISESWVEKIRPFSLFVPMKIGTKPALFVLSKPSLSEMLDYEDRDFIHALSTQISQYLELINSNNRLQESKQFESFHKMSAFVLHDLKNISSQLQLITQNTERHHDNPDFISDTFETVTSASKRLDKTIRQLNMRQLTENYLEKFNMIKQIKLAIKQNSSNNLSPILKTNEDMDSHYYGDKTQFTHIISHLINNAIQSAKDNISQHRVDLEFINNDTEYQLIISDNGIGMSSEFVKNKLFKPFYTTKGNSGMGIGAYEAKTFIESIGGSIKVISNIGKGSRFILLFPKNDYVI